MKMGKRQVILITTFLAAIVLSSLYQNCGKGLNKQNFQSCKSLLDKEWFEAAIKCFEPYVGKEPWNQDARVNIATAYAGLSGFNASAVNKIRANFDGVSTTDIFKYKNLSDILAEFRKRMDPVIHGKNSEQIQKDIFQMKTGLRFLSYTDNNEDKDELDRRFKWGTLHVYLMATEFVYLSYRVDEVIAKNCIQLTEECRQWGSRQLDYFIFDFLSSTITNVHHILFLYNRTFPKLADFTKGLKVSVNSFLGRDYEFLLPTMFGWDEYGFIDTFFAINQPMFDDIFARLLLLIDPNNVLGSAQLKIGLFQLDIPGAGQNPRLSKAMKLANAIISSVILKTEHPVEVVENVLKGLKPFLTSALKRARDQKSLNPIGDFFNSQDRSWQIIKGAWVAFYYDVIEDDPSLDPEVQAFIEALLSDVKKTPGYSDNSHYPITLMDTKYDFLLPPLNNPSLENFINLTLEINDPIGEDFLTKLIILTDPSDLRSDVRKILTTPAGSGKTMASFPQAEKARKISKLILKHILKNTKHPIDEVEQVLAGLRPGFTNAIQESKAVGSLGPISRYLKSQDQSVQIFVEAWKSIYLGLQIDDPKIQHKVKRFLKKI